jgi:hypothetical protein
MGATPEATPQRDRMRFRVSLAAHTIRQLGIYSLLSLTNGSFCTGIGAGTLLVNTAKENTATGAGGLFSNTTGFGNTANGTFALFSNTEGNNNTAIGDNALLFNTSGSDNTANGFDALQSSTIGTDNTAVGSQALSLNTQGSNNTATGRSALNSNTTGNLNTATGLGALFSNTTGIGNAAQGGDALFLNDSGAANTAIGTGALSQNTIGNNNIAVGAFAGLNLTTGNHNIDIANQGATGDSDTIRIGDTFHTSTFIAAIREVTTGTNDAIPVVIDSDGQLGTMSSSKRFKKEIKPMDKASEAIHALKPVTFHYKSDKTHTPQFGLIAEEVARVNPDLVVRDADGEIYTVRYDQVNAMLLNEFLKEHRKVEQVTKDFESKLAEQQKQIEALVAGLQKVSAQVEMNQPAAQTVLYNLSSRVPAPCGRLSQE